MAVFQLSLCRRRSFEGAARKIASGMLLGPAEKSPLLMLHRRSPGGSMGVTTKPLAHCFLQEELVKYLI